ncbi:MAG: class II glutamine amidotransferase [Armatimonadota bacterium]
MCGQCGIIFGKRDRSKSEIKKLTTIFTGLLAANEHRGRYATGVANIRMDGTYEIHKAPVNATMFVISDGYRKLMDNVDSQTTILMGHTRWPTQGSHLNNNNNHPLVIDDNTEDGTGVIIGTHNGHISNWKALFATLGYPRTTEVDSEIILRMAQDAIKSDSIDKSALTRLLSRCKGQMSAVMTLLCEPGRIIVVKGSKPLEIFYHRKRDVLLYASELDFMAEILMQEGGWSAVDGRPMSVVEFRYEDLRV